MDITAFFSLNYGLYIVSSAYGDEKAGCIVNTFSQVTAEPIQVSVALNKGNRTTEVIQKAGCFTAVCLAQDVPMETIGTFGFHSGVDTDKFAAWPHASDAAGMPYVIDHTVARFSAKVVDTLDLGTHILFIGEATEAEVTSSATPMTYAYYHQVKGGKTPPKASTFAAEETLPVVSADPAVLGKKRIGWLCSVCGYIEWADELADDFICPVCGVGKDMFERIEE
ncbi:MAG: flavin reductase [Raoultibacter sp.]